jgi:hypothetical protein
VKVNKARLAAVAACGVWAVFLLVRFIFDGLCPVGRCSCSYDAAHLSLINNVLWSMTMPLLVGLVARMGGIKTAIRAIPVAAGFEFATLCLVINDGFHCFIAKPAYFLGCIALYAVGAVISVLAAFLLHRKADCGGASSAEFRKMIFEPFALAGVVSAVLLVGEQIRWIGLTEPTSYDCRCYLLDEDYLSACARVPWCMLVPLAAIRCFTWKRTLGWIVAILTIVFYFVTYRLVAHLLGGGFEIGEALIEGGVEALKEPECIKELKDFSILFSGTVVSLVLFLKPSLLRQFKNTKNQKE